MTMELPYLAFISFLILQHHAQLINGFNGLIVTTTNNNRGTAVNQYQLFSPRRRLQQQRKQGQGQAFSCNLNHNIKSRIITTATVEQSQQEEQEQEMRNSDSGDNEHHQHQHQEQQQPKAPTPLTEMIDKFQSYASNIGRTRQYIHNNNNNNNNNNKRNNIKIMKKVRNQHQEEVINYNPNPSKPSSPSSSSSKPSKTLSKSLSSSSSTSCMSAIRSFVSTLQNETNAVRTYKQQQQQTQQQQQQNQQNDVYQGISIDTIEELQKVSNRAIIQALRASADYGDYNMILKIIDSSIEYAKEISSLQVNVNVNVNVNVLPSSSSSSSSVPSVSMPLSFIEARIFGEAITELKRTKASVSKIKKVWRQFMMIYDSLEEEPDYESTYTSTTTSTSTSTTNRMILATQPSSYELNAMLLALSSRGKVRAALVLFYDHALGQRKNQMTHDDGRHNVNDTNNNDNGRLRHLLHIDGDEYTASTIMNILAESIASDVEAYPPPTQIQTTQQTQEQKQKQQSKHKKSKTNKHGNKICTSTTPLSPCWQWREAQLILDQIEKRQSNVPKPIMRLNNYVYTAVLKVNEEASDLYKYPGNRHYGSTTAMSILERMKKQCISPDVVTCSAVMSAFDKGKQWKAALALLKSMERSERKGDDDNDDDGDSDGDSDSDDDKNHFSVTTGTGSDMHAGTVWELPLPNQYSYASAISSCARSGQFDEAIGILDRIREKSSSTSTSTCSHKDVPNIWIYNAALAACVPTNNLSKKYKVQNNNRSKTAIEILRMMEEDATNGMDTAPDTISYNTIIAAIGGLTSRYIDSNDEGLQDDFMFSDENNTPVSSGAEMNTIKLLKEMKKKGVHRDPITYYNAILSCGSDGNAAIRLLDIALEDIKSFRPSVISKWVSLDEIKSYLINVALSICASKGDMDLVKQMFGYMNNHNINANSRSMSYLLTAISSSESCEDSMWVLNAMKGDGAANAMIAEKHNINIFDTGDFSESPMIEEYHYSLAITGCLRQGQLFPALKILNGMKVHGLKPNESSLQGIILAYCKLATEASSFEFKEARAEFSKKHKVALRAPMLVVKHTTSRTRAIAALAMLKSMKEAPIKLQSIVASACAAAGMWVEARELLWSIHTSAVKERDQENLVEPVTDNQGSALRELPKLHRSLLKLCARSGNVKASLWYSDAIQDLSFKFERRKRRNMHYSSKVLRQFEPDKNNTEVSIAVKNAAFFQPPHKKDNIGMGGEEWKLVNVAASKSRHWKVCLGALQFLQPYVEATHPRHETTKDGDNLSLCELNREYESFASALTDSILAFEIRGQYAWAVRAIHDWVEWSGRRPRREALFAACRILASRGLGNQVTSLVTKVLNIPSHETELKDNNDEIPTYEASYERAVYTEAITSLVKHGLYDNADEMYANAAAQGFLPWAIIDNKSSSRLHLDLHGMNKAIAHSAVRVSLQHLIQTNSKEEKELDVIIVTGRGKRSSQHLRPVLRPEVQRMLLEEFYPPLGTSSVPGNMGALSISGAEVNAWVNQQQQQKGVRFLAVADVLKTLTSGDRLKQLLKRKVDESTPPMEK